MADDTGLIYDEKSKTWGYRLKMKDGTGKKVDTSKKGFATKTEARKARRLKVFELEDRTEEEQSKVDYTFDDVFEHYIENRGKEKRPSTIVRQKSIYNNHIKLKFGANLLKDTTKGDLYNYLLNLYHEGDTYNSFERGYSYAYVEGFLKLFFLIFGYAHDHDWITAEQYAKMFVNRGTKLTMPKEKEEEEEEVIEVYTDEEINKIREVIQGTNAELCFMFGYYCGLRIGETMGLLWDDINWSQRTLRINKQMQFYSPYLVLVPPKTKKSKRTVNIPEVLYAYLKEYKKEQETNRKERGSAYRATEVVKKKLKGKEVEIVGGNFIQRKKNGEIITSSSMKYWARILKEKTGIHFKYHNLRHTNASKLAALNLPIKTLQEHLGHSKSDVAHKYYVTSTLSAKEQLKKALDTL